MYLKLFLAVLLSAFVSILQSQELDSLERLLPTVEGRETVDVLVEIAIIKQLDGGEVEAEAALAIAREIGYKQGEIKALSTLAYTFLHKDEYDEAKTYFLECIEVESNPPSDRITPAYIGLGYIAIFQNQFVKGLDYSLTALDLATNAKSIQGMINARNNLVALYDAFSNWEKSKEQLLEILALKDSLNNEQLAILYLDMAGNSQSRNQSINALYFNKKGKTFVDKITNPFLKRDLNIYRYENLANTYNKLNLPDSAIYFAKLVFIKGKSILDPYSIAVNNLSLTKSYVLKNDFGQAKIYAKDALNYFKNTFRYEELKELHEVLKEIALGESNYEKAIELDEKIYMYSDSIASAATAMKVMEHEAQIYLEEKEAKIERLKETDKSKNIAIWIVGITLGILLILMMLLFNKMKHKRKIYKENLSLVRNRSEEKEIEQKAIIEKERNEKLLLKEELDSKNHSLASSAIFIANKNHLLSDVKLLLEKTVTRSKPEVRKLLKSGLREISQRTYLEEDWHYFNEHFKQVQPAFYENIRKNFPNLTETDYRLCSYIHLKLSNKEIAQLQNISVSSVRTARYRLKKKMGVEGSLTQILHDLS